MPTVREILVDWLKANGYEGLSNPRQACGCEVDDLELCAAVGEECEAGHKVPCDPETCEADGDCPWHMVPGRKEADPPCRDCGKPLGANHACVADCGSKGKEAAGGD